MSVLPKEYKTVKSFGCDEITEKKSRFIGSCMPVHSADDAQEFVRQVKKKYNDARHNCYAYYLKDGSMRYSDDGEPQGTAGQPILDVLVKGDVRDCVVVVTRYFGGVLLGTGGLTHAYSSAAKIAVNAAGPVEMAMADKYSFVCDYALYGSVQVILQKHGATIDKSDFSDVVSLEFFISPNNAEKMSNDLSELCAGKMKLTMMEKTFLEKNAKI